MKMGGGWVWDVRHGLEHGLLICPHELMRGHAGDSKLATGGTAVRLPIILLLIIVTEIPRVPSALTHSQRIRIRDESEEQNRI